MPRNKVPTKIKEDRGTLRANRINELEPKLSIASPTPPSHMTKLGKKYYREICQIMEDMGTIAVAFVFTIERLAVWLEIVRRIEGELSSLSTITYTTINKDGSPLHRTYTAFTALAEAESKVGYYLSKCGLTPSDLSNVHATPKADDNLKADDFAEHYVK